jgi:hypothetical protein
MRKSSTFFMLALVSVAFNFCYGDETNDRPRYFPVDRILSAGTKQHVKYDLRKICRPADQLIITAPTDGLAIQGYWDEIIFGKSRHNLILPGFIVSDLKNTKDQQPSLISNLKGIFKDEGVPHDLVWLAEVESSLNPNAESKVGAVGLFQLMPATAERFGLQLFPADDRKIPDKSARAAACYLRQLHKEFGGWALALAAYNAGEGRVSRTMKSHNARTFREVARHLPSETRKYVPRVMAMIALREDQSRGVPSALSQQ